MDKSRTQKNQTLSIAGFSILIDYQQVIDFEVKKMIFMFINQYYKQALSPYDKRSSFDFKIVFTDNIQLKISELQKNKSSLKECYMNIFSLQKKTVFVEYHISIIQFQYLIKVILGNLLSNGAGFILHSSAIEYKNKIMLFLGKNGAGKSTIVQNLKSISTPFADDTLIMRKRKNKWFAYQLPLEKNGVVFDKNTSKQVIALFFIKKYNVLKFKELSTDQTNAKFISQLVGVRIDEDQIKNALFFVAQCMHKFDLFCPLKIDQNAVDHYFKKL